MDITYFFKWMYKPFMEFVTWLVNVFIKLADWFGSKKPGEKRNIRSNFIYAILVSLLIWREVDRRISETRVDSEYSLENKKILLENESLKKAQTDEDKKQIEELQLGFKEMEIQKRRLDSITIELEVLKRTKK